MKPALREAVMVLSFCIAAPVIAAAQAGTAVPQGAQGAAAASGMPGAPGIEFTIVSRFVNMPRPAEPLVRTGQSGAPIEVRLMGQDLVALLLIVPFETVSGLLTVNLQSQVWHRNPDGSLSYHSALKTIAVPFGGTIIFHPLGMDSRGIAPVSLDITVDRR